MNKNLFEYKQYIRTKRVAVLGIGISNTPLIKYLADLGVQVTAFDMAEADSLRESLEVLKDKQVEYRLGKDYLTHLKGFDVIFKTPRVRYDIPELIAEQQRGAEVTSEMEVFVDLCPAQIFAVTGSDGKTTTTTLIYELLKSAGYKCWLGGNIGVPLLSNIDEISQSDKVVLELSSFQLHTMKKSPDIAVVTNLSPNHLDVHKSMGEYIEAKKNIFLYQSPKDKLILNYDNEITKGFEPEANGEAIFFSRKHNLAKGAYLENNKLIYSNGNQSYELINKKQILLKGVHNLENYLAAIAAVFDYVDISDIEKVASTFGAVEHRMEFVRTLNDISFYNDSIGSSPTRTIAGLRAFEEKVVLIAGGYDKNIPFDEMGPAMSETLRALVLLGATGPKIEEALRVETQKTGIGRDIEIIYSYSMEEAVTLAYKAARPGDAVVLSPASASFDMFKNFEERGNLFKEVVNNLK